MPAENAKRGKQPQIVDNRFAIRCKLGQGSFGDIFEVNDQQSNRVFACKLEPLNAKHPQLEWEILVYRAICNPVSSDSSTSKGRAGGPAQPQGFPRVHATGKTRLTSRNKTHHYRYMVMDRLGKSLEDLYNLCDRRFSVKTICMIGIQLISRIEHLHNHHYIHRDIKPDNFLIGSGSLQSKRAQVIHVIDFGLCKRVRDQATGVHIKYKEGKRLTGTPRYASINTHNGIEQSRRDDLESLGYMLIYFKRKKLPWQGLKAQTKQEKYTKIGARKTKTPLSSLCEGMPRQFITYIEYVRGLKFDQTPDYKYLRHLFFEILRDCKMDIDWIFDWNKPTLDIVKKMKDNATAGRATATTKQATATKTANRHVHATTATVPQTTAAAAAGKPRERKGVKRPREPPGTTMVVDLTSEKDDAPHASKRARPNPAPAAGPPKIRPGLGEDAIATAWKKAYNAMEIERDKYKIKCDEYQSENLRLKKVIETIKAKHGIGRSSTKPTGDPPDSKRLKA